VFFDKNELVLILVRAESGLNVRADVYKPDGNVVSDLVVSELVNFCSGLYALYFADTVESGLYFVRFRCADYPSEIYSFVVR
jgi:hypothetical protein